MPTNKITAKQEAFAQCIAKGDDQATAYRTAYKAGHMKDETVYPHASRLMKNDKVMTRVAELRTETAEQQLWTREMSVVGLIKAFDVAASEKQAAGMTGAVRELNQMHGFNEPTKLAVDIKLTPLTDEDWL